MPSPNRYLHKLLRLNAVCRWLVVLCLWLSVGTWSIWKLWADIELWFAYFTWAAVRSALRYEPIPFMGLGLCVAATLAVLVWHSGHILFGVSRGERRLLLRQLAVIKGWKQGHPLHFVKKLVWE